MKSTAGTGSLPRVRHCEGSPAAAAVAKAIASLLRTEIAEERVAVVDGCEMACTRRSLEAGGIAPLSITVEELGVDPDEPAPSRTAHSAAVSLLRSRAGASAPAARTRRAAPPAHVAASRPRGHSTDDYLYAINLLTSPVAACGTLVADAPTVSAHVARSLSVSRATAGEMLVRLESSGLIVRSPARDILLSPAGRVAAERVVHRHRLVERFLVDHLGCTAAESFELALEMRDGLPDRLVERLELVVDPGARCPHGWPLDPGEDHAFATGLIAVSTVEAGAHGTVEALVESDADVLAALFGYAIEPTAEIAVLAHTRSRTQVEVETVNRVLTEAEASAVLIRARES